MSRSAGGKTDDRCKRKTRASPSQRGFPKIYKLQAWEALVT
jgi:hypothetical protein